VEFGRKAYINFLFLRGCQSIPPPMSHDTVSMP
jgi:hypothetical protein